jgi:hypothetical protein
VRMGDWNGRLGLCLWSGVVVGGVRLGRSDGVDSCDVETVVGVDGRRRGERNGAFRDVARRRRLGSRSNISSRR